MTDVKTTPPTKVRVQGRRRKLLLKVFGVFVLFCAATLWYVHTQQFQNWLHWKIVSALEQATGGKVELGEFHTIPLQMRVEMRNLIIHGSEKPGEPPLAQIAKVEAQLRLKIEL